MKYAIELLQKELNKELINNVVLLNAKDGNLAYTTKLFSKTSAVVHTEYLESINRISELEEAIETLSK